MALIVMNNTIEHDIEGYIYKLFDSIRKNTYVEVDYSIPQNQRQRALLEYLKSFAGNEMYRSLVEKYLFELGRTFHESIPHKFRCYEFRLMLSEWMLEVPHDFSEKWIMIPCPLGKRCILIAGRNVTDAYSTKDWITDSFHSTLPGGNYDAIEQECTILDCIWIESLGTFYVLDVLLWNGQPLTHHKAEYRLSWLNDKISQLPQLKDRNIETNKYPIIPLPNAPCNTDWTEALKNFNYFLSLNGVLFYNRDSPYIFGYSPLVTWLKPFMLSEVLGVTISIQNRAKPENYVDFKSYIHQTMKNQGKEKKNSKENEAY